MKCRTKDDLLKLLLIEDHYGKIELGVTEYFDIEGNITKKLKKELNALTK